MDPPEIARIARNFSVMARIRGPDPKSLKMKRHAFHLHQDGVTTLSASGILLPGEILGHMQVTWDHQGDIIMTSASLVEPFLVAEQRKNPTQETCPKLIPDVHIDILLEGENINKDGNKTRGTPHWVKAQLLNLVDVHTASLAILSLLGDSAWDIGWALAHMNKNKVKNEMDPSRINYIYDELGNPSILAKSATRIAFLGITTLERKKPVQINVSQEQQQGESLIIMGSPFGILSPLHFFNSVSVGSVANCIHPGVEKSGLLMADVHCLPGMEGSLVFDRNAHLVGMLTIPLRQRASHTEVQLVITWDAIATALSKAIQTEPVNASTYTNNGTPKSGPHSPVALITIDGSWASGIVLNNRGLILTNAHLLEPWRFGRTSSLGLVNNTDRKENNQNIPNPSGSILSLKRDRKISVRVNCLEGRVWCGASVVYVSRGPLDVALVQLESVPSSGLCVIEPEFDCPSVGQSVRVIGHGLLGPRSGLDPSVLSGVVSNVVSIQGPLYLIEPDTVKIDTSAPVMLQTTAAVHPGASGGALINSNGRMVGLITSNARHGGGTTIPHMNFSIPCKSLEPIFKFSEKGEMSILQQLDKPNEILSSVWALAPTSSALPKPPDEESDGQGKGSQFLKFLNDSKDLEQILKVKLHSRM